MPLHTWLGTTIHEQKAGTHSSFTFSSHHSKKKKTKSQIKKKKKDGRSWHRIRFTRPLVLSQLWCVWASDSERERERERKQPETLSNSHCVLFQIAVRDSWSEVVTDSHCSIPHRVCFFLLLDYYSRSVFFFFFSFFNKIWFFFNSFFWFLPADEEKYNF